MNTNDLDAFKASYREKMQERLVEIDELWQVYMSKKDKDNFEKVFRKFHNLCGSAEMFGCKEVGESAREIADYMEERLNHESISDAEIDFMAEKISAFKTVCRETCSKKT